MRGKLIVITGIMALGLSACGAQGSDPVGGSSSSEVIGSAEAAVTEESTSETGESMEATVSTETVSTLRHPRQVLLTKMRTHGFPGKTTGNVPTL